MKTPSISMASVLIFTLLYLLSFSSVISSDQNHENFLKCLQSKGSNSISNVIYTPKNSSYKSTLLFSIQNQRFVSPSMPKPLVIVTPLNEFHVQTVITCSQIHGQHIRVRSGGHDYEGLSYISEVPFVIVDLRNLESIKINVEKRTAWVQAGVLLGAFSYSIAKNSPNLAVPAGLCPTVGVSGHFSGGGYGTLLRKYGLAADNIIDARIVNAKGEILDRKSMGEDLFWAIRGGGAASFGVVTSWKIKMVEVPDIVTVFTVNRTLEQNATNIVHRWQYIAHKFDENLFVRILITRVNQDGKGKRFSVQASFNSIFLGRIDKLLPLMQESFPELGLQKQDCLEKSWIEAVLYFSDLPSGSTLKDLTNRNPNPRTYYKAKSDYVREPIPKHALEGLWDFFQEDEAEISQLIFAPYGGKMSEISSSETPFPHRAGNLYEIQYLAYWDEEENQESDRYINWIRRLYKYMASYVRKNPRPAFLNYRDLDLGVKIAPLYLPLGLRRRGLRIRMKFFLPPRNPFPTIHPWILINNINGSTSYEQASVWGIKYFLDNFKRLVHVKSKVDPVNFFRNEQSIPVLTS